MAKRTGPKKKATSIARLNGSRRVRKKASTNRTPKPRPPKRRNRTKQTKPAAAKRQAAERMPQDLTRPASVNADAIARRYFDWLVEALKNAGIAEPIDRTVIELMSLDYAEMRRALDAVRAEGTVLTSVNTGNRYHNPHWAVMVAAKKRLDSRFAELGMTPRSRQTMEFDTAPADDKPDLLSFASARKGGYCGMSGTT